MQCTCQRVVSVLRRPTSRIAAPVLAVRTIASSSSSRAPSTSPPSSTAPASSVPESSCPAGTVLKNLNFVKDASDPVALEDDQYPAWVWTLTEARKPAAEGQDEAANLRHQRKALKAERKVSMKAANALKG
ncbi:hypothetical protein JCM3774_003412 [Rhodotorula dairenensis]